MKDMIILIENHKDNKKPFIIENEDKTATAKIAELLNAINLNIKYSWAISNSNMDVAKNLRLTIIKKY